MSANRRRLGVGLTTLVVLGLAGVLLVPVAQGGKPKPPPPPPPVAYTMELLPLLEGSTSCFVGGMNNSGDVVGVANMADGPQRGFLYTPETGTVDLNDADVFPVPDSWSIGGASDINDSGQIGGGVWFQDADGQTRLHAFRYTPGEGFIELGPLPDGYPWSNAGAINSQGDVVGTVENDGATQTRAFLWTEQSGMVLLIGGNEYNAARGINDFTQVVGSMKVSGEPRAFRYTPGVGVVNLGAAGRSKLGDLWSRGYGINNSGQVVGGTTVKGAYYERAFRYTDGQGMKSLGTLDNNQWTWSRAVDVNAAGQIVGPSSISTGGNYQDQETRTFLYTDATGMLDLWSLISNPPPGTTATDVYYWELRINDGVVLPNGELSSFGQICGTIGGVPFILTPDR